MSGSHDERIAAYEASIARLTGANADLRAEQRRMKWVAIATAILFLPAYIWLGATVAVFVVIAGGSVFLVGHYVLFAHLHENRLTIRSAKQMIASISDGMP